MLIDYILYRSMDYRFLAKRKILRLIQFGQTVLGEVSCALPEIDNPYYDTRCNQLALKAVLEIESCILNAISKYGNDRVGVVIGSSNSGMREFQNEYYLYSRCNNPNKPLANGLFGLLHLLYK